jgi:hypothetical protein
MQRRSGKDRSDLQILTLDDTLTTNNMPNKSPNNQSVNVDRLEETFRREGNAEILELSHSTLGDSVGGDDCSERIRSRQVNFISIQRFIIIFAVILYTQTHRISGKLGFIFYKVCNLKLINILFYF